MDWHPGVVSDIGLQWCLVEDSACPQSSFVSSVQVMCTCLTERQSPDLIIASRNGLRAISLWAAAWATTTLLRNAVRKVTGQTAFDFVVSSSSLLLCTIQSVSRHGYFCRQLQQSLFIANGPDWSDVHGIMSTNSSSFHCMQHIPVRLPRASISTYSIFRTPSMSDIHLPVEHTRLTESRSTYKIELDLSGLFSNF